MGIVVNNIVDFHTHILPNIDDGAKDLDESIKMIDNLVQKGVSDIVLTPHYIKNTKYNINNQKKHEIMIELKKKYPKVNLYLGNEVYITEDLIQLLHKGEITTINNSSYLLIELPMNSKITNLDSIIYDLIRNGITPIIAHPERYLYVQENIHDLDEYLEMGVLLQGNYESLFGKYGKASKRILKKLLRQNKITVLGSDIHNNQYVDHTEKLDKKLLKIVHDEQIVSDLMRNNAMRIINNQELTENKRNDQ